jgi:hypothetical protein
MRNDFEQPPNCRNEQTQTLKPCDTVLIAPSRQCIPSRLVNPASLKLPQSTMSHYIRLPQVQSLRYSPFKYSPFKYNPFKRTHVPLSLSIIAAIFLGVGAIPVIIWRRGRKSMMAIMYVHLADTCSWLTHVRLVGSQFGRLTLRPSDSSQCTLFRYSRPASPRKLIEETSTHAKQLPSSLENGNTTLPPQGPFT